MTEEDQRELRLAERRQRIQLKMKEISGDGAVRAVGDEGPAPKRGHGEETVLEVRRAIADVRGAAHSAVTNWEVVIGANENERREAVERQMEERRKQREEELAENAARHGGLELQFVSIFKMNVPLELHHALETQRKQCNELISVKDRLIEALRSQLEEREEEFVRCLRRDAANVHNLIGEMRIQTERYLDQYAQRLREVEGAYEKERTEKLNGWDEEVRQLVKLRRTRETEYRKRREEKVMDAQKCTDDKHRENCEEYNSMKREHLNEIHSLMEELERCKAEFLLNDERLSYNLQVLRERVKENKNAHSQHKRKLARLQDTLSTLVARHAESEKRYQRANRDLTAQLHRVADQYRDLQKKFQKFEKSDKEKHRQLWRMHEEKNTQLAHRCLQADRMLFEEIIGVPWQPPELNFWPDHESVSSNEEEDDDDGKSSEDELELSEEALMLLEILHKQAPFIADENVERAIRQVKDVSEERVIVESILATLQLRKNDEVEDLLEYFVVDGPDETKALIRPQEAVRALSDFLGERQKRRNLEEETKKQSANKNKQLARVKQEERRRAAEREYWGRMAEAVPKNHRRLWSALETGLGRYIDQLQQRKALIEQTDTLRVQNNELRGLLGQYLESEINCELHTPPQLLLQARAESMM